HHVGHTAPDELCRQGEIADFGHSRVADGAGTFEHQNRAFIHRQVRVVYAGAIVLHVLENDGPAAMRHQLFRRGGRFDDRTLWREVSTQHDYASLQRDRLVSGADHLFIVAVCPRQTRLQRTALDGGSIEVQQILDALHHRGNTTGIEEVLHQETAGGFQVDKAWNAR